MLFQLGTKAWSAIAASVVLVSAVIAGVAVASDDDFDPVYAPEWQPGYTFSYDVLGSVDMVYDGLEAMDMPGDGFSGAFGPFQVKKEILNTQDYESHGQPLFVSAANFPMSNIQSGEVLDGIGSDPTFLMAERQNDLAPLAVMPNWDCRSNDCAGGAVKVMADNPLTYLNFPLTQGKKWVQEEELPIPVPIEELAGITRVHIVGEVTGMEAVDLGELGTTQAVRVDFAYRPVGLEDILSQIVKQAEDAGVQVDRFNVQMGVHEIVHYSPEYEAIVQQQYLISVLFDVAFSGEFYGQSFSEDIYAELDGSITAVLTGSNRAVTEEQTPVQILQKLGNVDLINDARGLGVSAQRVPYSISLDGARSEVNVAKGEAARYAVGVAGDLPAGHSLEYVVKELGGPEIASGIVQGGTFTVELGEPGVYGVTVRGVDGAGGVVTTSATRYLEGDYDALVSADCNFGGLGTYCAPFEFLVKPGADSAVFEAYTYGGTPPLSQTLYVRAPDGTAYDTQGRHVELDADEIEELGYGHWRIDYNNVGGVLSEVDYLLSIDYEAPQAVPQVPAPDRHNETGSGGGLLDLMGRMLQTVDGGLQGLDDGKVELDLAGVLG